MELLKLIDVAGIVAFSIAGAVAAMEKRLDIFGILIIAFITALGGGTLRDVLTGAVPVNWMFDLRAGMIVICSTAGAILFRNVIENLHRILLFFDSIGLGFFTILGVQKGIALELHPAVCITLGTITACFGGVIRDISLNNIPLIFEKEIYATACLLGGIGYFLLSYAGLHGLTLDIICITIIVVTRLLAVKYNWRLPGIGKADA